MGLLVRSPRQSNLRGVSHLHDDWPFLLQSSGQGMPLGFRVERACEAVYGRIMGPQNPWLAALLQLNGYPRTMSKGASIISATRVPRRRQPQQSQLSSIWAAIRSRLAWSRASTGQARNYSRFMTEPKQPAGPPMSWQHQCTRDCKTAAWGRHEHPSKLEAEPSPSDCAHNPYNRMRHRG